MAPTSSGAALLALTPRLLRLAALLAGAHDILAAPAGQSGGRWQVLACTDPQPATVAAIARRLGLTRQSVQRTADLLVQAELAEYRPNPEHRRAKLLRPTPAGQRVLTALENAHAAWADRVGAGLGEPDLRAAAQVLDGIMRAVEREAARRT